ncbi:MAG: hydroxymethylglutaryl-CoA lyase [Chloroflexi bacterium]|nr:hydroxymethylglutaryl-CoA lyase [Ardenticatenaceae bacterium]MBL1130630.1 hydroxymethylglutaryl-CoA lyase [Chloroflexota bacterium]NOG36724.1 hydroxymethylglutaryl-CoA lyase [Chloroflexota bacterium]GIK56764.1 MAG: hydroxymethylglutaryl-CoA lyase [Chloroflexota bacterium]
MPDYLKVHEVGPRDGLQNEATPVSTAQKNRLVDGLVDAGLQHIELTSFVHPKAVPQMADADEVTAVNRQKYPHINFVGLVFNQRGYERALAAGCRAIACGVSVSETFSQKNTRMSSQEAQAISRSLVEQAKRDGLWTRAYVMTAWVCPFEGPTPPYKTVAVAETLWSLGVDELAIADTIGFANPLDVGRLMENLGRRLDMNRLAVHLHDTQAMGLANATTAIQAGVRIFDSSVGGLGGCPFAPGAAGNLATEDLVFLAYKMGIGTGVDFQRLWDVVHELETFIGRPVGGRIRAWWESTYHTEPTVEFR